MHWFIPSSGDALIAQEKLFPNAGATQNHIRVQPALFAAGMHAKIPYVLDVGSGSPYFRSYTDTRTPKS